MSKEEFDAFIKSANLTWSYTGKPVTDADGFSIGPGWYSITANLIKDILALSWDGQLACVKEKFGGGRFYIESATKEVHDRIRIWEHQTFETCEKCGTTEDITTEGKWAITLCKSCRTKKHE